MSACELNLRIAEKNVDYATEQIRALLAVCLPVDSYDVLDLDDSTDLATLVKLGKDLTRDKLMYFFVLGMSGHFVLLALRRNGTDDDWSSFYVDSKQSSGDSENEELTTARREKAENFFLALCRTGRFRNILGRAQTESECGAFVVQNARFLREIFGEGTGDEAAQTSLRRRWSTCVEDIRTEHAIELLRLRRNRICYLTMEGLRQGLVAFGTDFADAFFGASRLDLFHSWERETDAEVRAHGVRFAELRDRLVESVTAVGVSESSLLLDRLVHELSDADFVKKLLLETKHTFLLAVDEIDKIPDGPRRALAIVLEKNAWGIALMRRRHELSAEGARSQQTLAASILIDGTVTLQDVTTRAETYLRERRDYIDGLVALKERLEEISRATRALRDVGAYPLAASEVPKPQPPRLKLNMKDFRTLLPPTAGPAVRPPSVGKGDGRDSGLQGEDRGAGKGGGKISSQNSPATPLGEDEGAGKGGKIGKSGKSGKLSKGTPEGGGKGGEVSDGPVDALSLCDGVLRSRSEFVDFVEDALCRSLDLEYVSTSGRRPRLAARWRLADLVVDQDILRSRRRGFDGEDVRVSREEHGKQLFHVTAMLADVFVRMRESSLSSVDRVRLRECVSFTIDALFLEDLTRRLNRRHDARLAAEFWDIVGGWLVSRGAGRVGVDGHEGCRCDAATFAGDNLDVSAALPRLSRAARRAQEALRGVRSSGMRGTNSALKEFVESSISRGDGETEAHDDGLRLFDMWTLLNEHTHLILRDVIDLEYLHRDGSVSQGLLWTKKLLNEVMEPGVVLRGRWVTAVEHARSLGDCLAKVLHAFLLGVDPVKVPVLRDVFIQRCNDVAFRSLSRGLRDAANRSHMTDLAFGWISSKLNIAAEAARLGTGSRPAAGALGVADDLVFEGELEVASRRSHRSFSDFRLELTPEEVTRFPPFWNGRDVVSTRPDPILRPVRIEGAEDAHLVAEEREADYGGRLSVAGKFCAEKIREARIRGGLRDLNNERERDLLDYLHDAQKDPEVVPDWFMSLDYLKSMEGTEDRNELLRKYASRLRYQRYALCRSRICRTMTAEECGRIWSGAESLRKFLGENDGFDECFRRVKASSELSHISSIG